MHLRKNIGQLIQLCMMNKVVLAIHPFETVICLEFLFFLVKSVMLSGGLPVLWAVMSFVFLSLSHQTDNVDGSSTLPLFDLNDILFNHCID